MSGGEMAKFVAATLRDKVVQEVSQENEALRAEIELLKGIPKAQLINSTTGECYGEGTFEQLFCVGDDNCVDNTCLCKLTSHTPVPLSTFLGSPCHITISGRFWGNLEGSLVKWHSWQNRVRNFGPHFLISSTDDSNIVYFTTQLDGTDADKTYRKKYATFTGHNPGANEWYDMDECKPIADLLSAFGDTKVTFVSIHVRTVDMVLRRPQSGMKS